jgi:ATP-dependent Lon protease
MFDIKMSNEMYEEDMEMIPMVSIDEDEDHKDIAIPKTLPILPLRNNVLFPGVVIPIAVGREKSLKAVKKAYKGDKLIAVIAQKDVQNDDPEVADLHSIGTVARIVKLLKMPDGGSTLIIQGLKRCELITATQSEPHIEGEIVIFEEQNLSDGQEVKAFIHTMKELATKIIELSPNIPNEAKIVLNNINNIKFLTHFVASNLHIEANQKQEILEINAIDDRIQLVLKHLHNELQLLELKMNIHTKTKTDIDKQQRDYFLNQQMRAIQEELGGDTFAQEIARMREKATTKKWSKAVADTFEKELNKLQRINPAAAEYSVILNWLELVLELPWEELTKDNFDLKHANNTLEEDHYGLDKIKDRILEYLAVLKLKGDMKSPILCFVGPPGVGKTSLGKSIAKALERKYVRIALGGLHDESEVRGHRKTYIGAMPGRIIQSLKKVQSSNPVFILDEIDKVGKDFRGDPSSALLEVLDPEQNSTFYDNFLELEYDLSKVMFIATANSLSTIQPALRDRMEIIHLNGYSVEEKAEIANKHLIDKQRELHGLKKNQVKIAKAAILELIDKYTRESGVRELDRQLAALMRHIAKKVAMEDASSISIGKEDLENILGKQKYNNDEYTKDLPVGVAIGMAWTPVGGDILFIEAKATKGKGVLTITGNLGNVMKESIRTALTILESKADSLAIPKEAFSDWNIHIHVPEGAVPKDGPSAGIAMFSALTSLFTQRQILPFLSMTGEITLRGKILPVGGIKEKVLAARRAGIKNIVMCTLNQKDVEEINPAYIKGLNFTYIDTVEQLIDTVLEKQKIKDALSFEVKKEEKQNT